MFLAAQGDVGLALGGDLLPQGNKQLGHLGTGE